MKILTTFLFLSLGLIGCNSEGLRNNAIEISFIDAIPEVQTRFIVQYTSNGVLVDTVQIDRVKKDTADKLLYKERTRFISDKTFNTVIYYRINTRLTISETNFVNGQLFSYYEEQVNQNGDPKEATIISYSYPVPDGESSVPLDTLQMVFQNEFWLNGNLKSQMILGKHGPESKPSDSYFDFDI